MTALPKIPDLDPRLDDFPKQATRHFNFNYERLSEIWITQGLAANFADGVGRCQSRKDGNLNNQEIGNDENNRVE